MWIDREYWRGKDVYRIVNLLQSEHQQTLQILNSLPLGVAVVEGAGEVIAANRTLTDMLAPHDVRDLMMAAPLRDMLAGLPNAVAPVGEFGLEPEVFSKIRISLHPLIENRRLLVLSQQRPAVNGARGHAPPPAGIEWLNASPAPTLVFNAEGAILFANTAIETATGLTAADIRSLPVTAVLKVCGPAAGEETLPAGRFTAELLSRSGESRRYFVETNPIDAAVRVASISGPEQPDALEAHIMSALERLSGHISHRFNNLLTPIITYSDMIVKRFGSVETLRQDATVIVEAGTALADLTGKLLTFSRGRPTEKTVSNVDSVLRSLVGMLTGMAGEAVQVNVETNAGAALVRTGTSELETMILSVVENAVDAMDGGEGTITVRTSLRRTAAAAFVCFEVRDEGSGIRENDIDHIWEPFFSTRQGRAGLGLSVVYGIVKRAGGSVQAENLKPNGCLFRICLPEAGVAGEDAS